MRIGNGARHFQGKRCIEHERVPVRTAILSREHGTHPCGVVRGVATGEGLWRATREPAVKRIALRTNHVSWRHIVQLEGAARRRLVPPGLAVHDEHSLDRAG